MIKKRRLLALLLGVLLVISIMGCQSKEAKTPAAEKPASTEAVSSEEESEPTTSSPYPDPNKSVEFDFFADCTWLDYDNLDGITGQVVKKQTGVTFNFTKATDSEQINLMMASGDLPDLVMTGSSSKQNKLSTDDLCYSFNELIATYASDWEVPEIEKNINAYYSEDGNFYMLKNEFNTIDQIKSSPTVGPNFGQMHMRSDIYEALGSPSMNNKAEIYSVFDSIKENYPDMVPIVTNLRQQGAIAAQLVGLDMGFPTDKNGEYCNLISDTKYYDFMLTFNELYRNGYMTKENFTYTTDEQVFEYASKGNAFIITHYAGNDDQLFTARVQATIPEASFVQVPLTEDWEYTMPVSGWAGLFITKNCKDPETAIKLVRWSKEPENQLTTMMGERGVDWDLTDDGVLMPLERYTASVEAGTKANDYTSVSFLISATDYLRESMNFYANATDATRLVFDDATQRANWSNVVDLCYPKSGTDENIINSDLNDLHDEYLSKLGTAESQEEFDAMYNELMQIASDMGIDKVNTYLSTTYKTLCYELSAK